MAVKRNKSTRIKPQNFMEVLRDVNPLTWQGDASWGWNFDIPFWAGTGELEALCELFFDNLATLLGTTGSAVSHIGYGLIAASWRNWGPPGYNFKIATEWEDMYFKWHIPACGIALFFGNLWYAWLACRLANKEKRTDVTAQPYGMNTTVIFITLYAMTLPALEKAHDKYIPWECNGDDGWSKSAECTKKYDDGAYDAAFYGWKVSVGVNFLVGLFEVLGCVLGEPIRWAFPRAALFTPLFGVGFVWLAFSPLQAIAQEPLMCVLPMFIVITGFFARVQYPIIKGKLVFPVALFAILTSIIIGWAGGCKHSTDIMAYGNTTPDYKIVSSKADIPDGYGSVVTSMAEFYNGQDFGKTNNPNATSLGFETCTGTDKKRAVDAWEKFAFKSGVMGGFGKGMGGLSDGVMKDWWPGALLFGIIGFTGTMTCVESADCAGDNYPMTETMIVDGIGTCLGAIFGSIYGTTVYIGHPAHKMFGAKIGYSIANGFIFLFLLCSGMFAYLYNVIPGCANGAILIFVGLFLARQAFEESPVRHYPALFLGVMPFICNMMQLESGGNHTVNPGVSMLAPAGGVIVGVFLCTVTALVIDRNFIKATLFCVVLIFLSLFGIFASYNTITAKNGLRDSINGGYETINMFDAGNDMHNGWKWAVAWTLCAAYFAIHIPFQIGNPYCVVPVLPPVITNDDEDPYDWDPDAEESSEKLPA